MKSTTYFSLGTIAILLLLGSIGAAMADPSVVQTPEIQGLVTTTSVDAAGLMTETDGLAWQLSNRGINTTLAAPGYLPYDPETGEVLVWDDLWPYMDPSPGQVKYTTAYDANIVGQAGQISYIKTMNVNTGNKVIGQSNVNAKTGLTYIATGDGGNVVGSENLLLDGAGMYELTAGNMLCPFAGASSAFIPPFCNIVQMGSNYDLTVGSVSTEASNRFVGADSTAPVVQNYNINVKPYGTSAGQIPAMGSAMAYLKLHTQEGRLTLLDQFMMENDEVDIYQMSKTQDLTYSETSSASGTISAFTKSIGYNSGMSLI